MDHGESMSSLWMDKFCNVLRVTRSVTAAINSVGRSRRDIFDLRKKDKDFAARWDSAIDSVKDDLEASALKRAIDGYEEPVFYKGKICGYKRVHCNALTIFMLQALKPEIYQQTNSGAASIEDLASSLREAISSRKKATFADVDE